MTKSKQTHADPLIRLGTASRLTKGSVPGNKPDGALPQQFIQSGLSRD